VDDSQSKSLPRKKRMWPVLLIVVVAIVLLSVSFTGYGVYRASRFPDSRINYEFADFDYWGLSSEQIGSKVRESREVSEILAGFEALQNIEIHSQSSLKDAFSEIRALNDYFADAGAELVASRSYASSGFESASGKQTSDLRHEIQASMFHALISIRKSVDSRGPMEGGDELGKNIEAYFEELRPESGERLNAWKVEMRRLEELRNKNLDENQSSANLLNFDALITEPIQSSEDLKLRLKWAHEMVRKLYSNIAEANEEDSAEIVSRLVETVPEFKKVVAVLAPQSNPRVLFFTSESKSGSSASDMHSLEGFDEVHFEDIDELLEPCFDRDLNSPQRIDLDIGELRDSKNTLASNNIEYMLALPIVTEYRDKPEVAGLLSLVLAGEVHGDQESAVRAIMESYGKKAFECALAMALKRDPIKEKEDMA